MILKKKEKVGNFTNDEEVRIFAGTHIWSQEHPTALFKEPISVDESEILITDIPSVLIEKTKTLMEKNGYAYEVLEMQGTKRRCIKAHKKN